jgi:hypothetical protein
MYKKKFLPLLCSKNVFILKNNQNKIGMMVWYYKILLTIVWLNMYMHDVYTFASLFFKSKWIGC